VTRRPYLTDDTTAHRAAKRLAWAAYHHPALLAAAIEIAERQQRDTTVILRRPR